MLHRTRSALAAVALSILVSSFPALGFSEGSPIIFAPDAWDFGTIEAGSRAFLTLQVTNTTSRSITISVIPTCGCLSTGPSKRVIPPGAQAEFRFSILAEKDEIGDVRETYLVQTDLKGMDHLYYEVHGKVKGVGLKVPD